MGQKNSMLERFTENVLTKMLPFAAALILLVGCEADQLPAGNLSGDNLSIAIPEKIRKVSAVNLNAVTAIANVTINGDNNNTVDYPMLLAGNRFRTSISLAAETTTVAVNIRFTETLDSGTVINLATHAQVSRAVNGGTVVMEFFDDDFVSENFDRDGDGISNLQERNLGTDPLVFSPVDQNRLLTVRFDLPAQIPDPLVTQSIVTFAGVPRARIRDGNRLTVTGIVTTLDDVAVEVVLLQTVNGQRVVLATAELTIAAGFNDLATDINSSDFDFSRDDDGDGQPNIEEVRNGTDPFNAG